MSKRLQRILDLSKRTGDTVVVHDPSAEHDVVVLPFDRYEELTTPRTQENFNEHLLEEMSERELIDKLNRDIAMWRSYQEMNEREKRASFLEDHLASHPPADPFEEDYSHTSEWHKVSDVIGERHGLETRESDQASDERPAESTEEIGFVEPRKDVSVHESLPLVNVPLVHGQEEARFESEEELDGEDPVFFEEPVV